MALAVVSSYFALVEVNCLREDAVWSFRPQKGYRSHKHVVLLSYPCVTQFIHRIPGKLKSSAAARECLSRQWELMAH
jgi:hypothetical protein